MMEVGKFYLISRSAATQSNLCTSGDIIVEAVSDEPPPWSCRVEVVWTQQFSDRPHLGCYYFIHESTTVWEVEKISAFGMTMWRDVGARTAGVCVPAKAGVNLVPMLDYGEALPGVKAGGCTCPLDTLMRSGCQCGAMEKERAARGAP